MPDTAHLAVFFYGCCLPVANGGSARLAELLDRLQAEFGRIILYSYADHPDFPWTAEAEEAFRARWPGIDLVLELYGPGLRRVTRLKNLLLSLLPSALAPGLLRVRVPGATPRFDAVKRRSGAFVISYTEGLTQVNGIDPRRCVVETHDVNFVKWAKMNGRSPFGVTALRKLRAEATALATVRGLVAIAAGEAAFFRMAVTTPVTFVPSWAAGGPPLPRHDGPADYDLVFVGSGYVMNVRGFCALIEVHGPWLARYRVALCGLVADDPAVRQAVAPYPTIDLAGFVADIDDIYRRSRAALSPVDGTGTKMKVLAALRAGLPVFASRHSRDGLPPGFEGAVFDISEKAVADVLGSDAGYTAALTNVRRYAATLSVIGEADRAVAELRRLVPTNVKPPVSRHRPSTE